MLWGKITVGVERNVVDAGLSADEIGYLLRNDIERCRCDLDKVLPWWRKLSEARQQSGGHPGDAGLQMGQTGRRAGRRACTDDKARMILHSLSRRSCGTPKQTASWLPAADASC